MSEDEKRRTPRKAVDFPVKMEDSESAISGTVRDISAGGCFVSAAKQLDVGTHAVICAIGEGEEDFVFDAKVVRVTPEGDQAGMGLQFTEVGPTALLGIRKHLVAGTRVEVSAGEEP